MKDGHTRKLSRSEVDQSLFLARHRATLVVIEGPIAGNEYVLETAKVTLGRGLDADITFQDDAMSREHACLELNADGYRIRDLGSTNGLSVNGSPVPAADLKHADKITLGEHVLQYVLEKQDQTRTYHLSDD